MNKQRYEMLIKERDSKIKKVADEVLLELGRNIFKKELGVESQWDVLMYHIDLEVKIGTGTLIRGIDSRVYGIEIDGHPIAFSRTSNDGFESIGNGGLPQKLKNFSSYLQREMNIINIALGFKEVGE